MRILIIRSCSRDEKRAHLCYLTAKKHNVADSFIFFHEKTDDSKVIPKILIETGERIHFRSYCDNFGGYSNVLQMVEDLKQLNRPQQDDWIIFSDADIIFNCNPFKYLDDHRIDHAGFGSELMPGRAIHYSGQLNFIRGWLWNTYLDLGEDNMNKLKTEMANYPIADDTIFSKFSHQCSRNIFTFHEPVWEHHKVTDKEYDTLIKLL